MRRTVFFQYGGGLLFALIAVTSLCLTLLLPSNLFSPSQDPFITETAETPIGDCSTLDSGTCKIRTASCIYDDPAFGGTGACLNKACSALDSGTCKITTGCSYDDPAFGGTGQCINSPCPRTTCDAIAGTPYCSDAERTWYLANCTSTGTTPETGTGGGSNPVPTPVLDPLYCAPGTICPGINLYGNDVGGYNNTGTGWPVSAQDCQIGCQEDSRCVAWTFQHDNGACWLKNPAPGPNQDDNTTSGYKVGGSSSAPPPAESTCSGPGKVLCGSQCYGVVAGSCSNWQCESGIPRCKDVQIAPTAIPTLSGGTGGTGGTVPTATRTPTPSRTPTPTATRTPTPSIAAGVPTNTATPTIQSGANTTQAVMETSIPGIGADTSLGLNPNPVTTSIPLEIQIFNAQNQKVKDATGTLIYDATSKTYKGSIGLGSDLPTSAYTVKTRSDNSLRRAQNIFITSGQTNNLPAISLVTGDLNQDNELNLIDYNIMISCYGTRECSQEARSDLNLDGKIDERDLNILYAAFSTRQGD